MTVSSQLVGAGQRLSEGAAQIASGVAMAGQKTGIESAMDSIKADKDDKIAKAFSRTFLTAALILMLASICGLFTDRKEKYAGEAALK